ncbi:bifunctional riboflavin kinase/FAD synthetase [Ectobacillus ponti]|uniref:Riboflavin biosynthesis protein n=1 Tax=Ectobacillus ponti TaxID=2961894 RepID=A0AA42BPE6_9BACI|nr:bifunctional riboflavin kinase/FAD synthetase [Ectobacillus ponti]
MKLVHLTHPPAWKQEDMPPTVLALGYFDGVHLGHQEVIRTAKRIADEYGCQSAVMTFAPHPAVVLRNSAVHMKHITPLCDKEQQIARLGIDVLYVVEFNRSFANLLPQQFVDAYIIALNVKHVVAGFDFTYGRLGKGTMETMPFHARGEFTQSVIEKVQHDEEKVSSTLLRRLISEGKMEELLPILGRYYTIAGTVVHGDKRGRQIGFPTANVGLTEDYMLPPTGVYAVRMKVEDVWYNGVCNIGYKPTFQQDEKKLSIEVHLFGFDQDIYGEDVVVEWHTRIRSEQRFNGIAELVAQIQRDKETAMQYFQQNEESACFF